MIYCKWGADGGTTRGVYIFSHERAGGGGAVDGNVTDLRGTTPKPPPKMRGTAMDECVRRCISIPPPRLRSPPRRRRPAGGAEMRGIFGDIPRSAPPSPRSPPRQSDGVPPPRLRSPSFAASSGSPTQRQTIAAQHTIVHYCHERIHNILWDVCAKVKNWVGRTDGNGPRPFGGTANGRRADGGFDNERERKFNPQKSGNLDLGRNDPRK
ncbi:hypothetical protein niasHT_039990 [Heterodera trifolii]|uniref:Uncharacterized protein n=1 Tax=Heterodera trifolii TaxID=157864 RepID=A0ABD2J6J9_9BILA